MSFILLSFTILALPSTSDHHLCIIQPPQLWPSHQTIHSWPRHHILYSLIMAKILDSPNSSSILAVFLILQLPFLFTGPKIFLSQSFRITSLFLVKSQSHFHTLPPVSWTSCIWLFLQTNVKIGRPYLVPKSTCFRRYFGFDLCTFLLLL